MKRDAVVLVFLIVLCGVAAGLLTAYCLRTAPDDAGLSTPIPPGKLTQPSP
jgi:hypothetical protein